MNDSLRLVQLTGDAFFDVESDSIRPFVISTQEVEIEVLGTSFYVDSRASQTAIQVIVESGTVAMRSNNQEVIIEAGEIGIYDKQTGNLSKNQNEDPNYLAWKTDIFVFDSTDLESVVFALNRKFHAQISLAGNNLNDCQLNATYDRQSLDAIIKIIEQTLGITATYNGDQIILSGDTCN